MTRLVIIRNVYTFILTVETKLFIIIITDKRKIAFSLMHQKIFQGRSIFTKWILREHKCISDPYKLEDVIINNIFQLGIF